MSRAQEILKQVYGYDEFRPQQEEAINNLLENRDSVVLMPTGGGKSLCYQIPAIIKPGFGIIVSPLIALMQDQVQRLKQEGIEAEVINSASSTEDRKRVFEKIKEGTLKMLYLSPEKLMTPSMLSFVQQCDVSLIAVDEAHCVSSWGHHFRPEYARLGELRLMLSEVPFIALTATADKTVRKDIAESLHMDSVHTYVSSFDRPEISLNVMPGQKKWQQIKRFLASRSGQSGIVYCLSRKKTESIAGKLQDAGFRAAFYHAGVSNAERADLQERFLNDEIDIICATIAFGMGIDKSNIRFVIHLNMPSNLESYYQEIGRAGRDGNPADTLLFYSYADVIAQMRFIDDIDNPTYREIQKMKLDRIKEYAESYICRRRILLSYFNEDYGKDCGNCDVCKNPPTFFDGTILVQKALSAVGRAEGKMTITMLNHCLRGTRNSDIIRAGLDKIKTYGAGRGETEWAWNLYIIQMIQLGLLEIDYKNGHRLRLTDGARDTLFNRKSVPLVDLATYKKRRENVPESKASPLVESDVDQDMYAFLKSVRNDIAKILRTPSYTIFNNETLQLFASQTPKNNEEFLKIKGVGKVKAERYGALFLHLISYYGQEEALKSDDFLMILNDLGLKKNQMMKVTGIDEDGLYTHFASIAEHDKTIRVNDILSAEDCEKIQAYLSQFWEDAALDHILDNLSENFSADKVKIFYHLTHSTVSKS